MASPAKKDAKEIDYVSKEANLTSQIESERQAAKRWWDEYGLCYLENAKAEDFTYDNRIHALKSKLADPNICEPKIKAMKEKVDNHEQSIQRTHDGFRKRAGGKWTCMVSLDLGSALNDRFSFHSVHSFPHLRHAPPFITTMTRGHHRQILTAALALAILAAAILFEAAAATRNGINCRTLPNPLQMASKFCICEPCHLCEFSFRNGGCGLIKTTGMSLLDGSEVPMEQPLLKPEQWFLTSDEITKSRGGVVRDDLSDYTSGNDVRAYVATREFFDAVFDDLEATRAKDRILLTGWSTDEVPFKPETDSTGAISGFHSVIGRAVARGVNFHALIWNNLLEKDQNVKMRNFINALPSTNKTGKAEFIFDDRLPAAASAHHQKTLVIQRENGEVVVAYVGGIDLTSDRWDTIKHDQDALRKKAGIDRGSNGWLDAQVRIEGLAAEDVAANFIARWNSKTKPATDLLDDVLDFENPAYSTLPALPSIKENVDGSKETGSESEDDNGPHNVQIMRTFSCKYKKYEFAPKGETSLFQARIKAIRNAKNYIYIEDQYFVLVPELLAEILKVLPQLQRIIVVAPRPETEVKIAGYEKFMFDMVSPIQKLFPNKFQFYTTKATRNLYIHTKLVIIDDVYVSIGSANWNRRSMTSDSEMGANVVDNELVTPTPDGITVNKLALDYRLRKFQEHTGLSYDSLKKMKFIDAANQFDLAAKDPSTIIEPLEVDQKAYFAAYASDPVRNLIDPQDVC